MMKCNICGNDNLDGAEFCKGCGSKLNNSISNTENNNLNNSIDIRPINSNIEVKSNNKTNKKGLLLIVLFGIISFTCIVTLSYFSLTTSSKEKNNYNDTYYSSITGEWIDSSNTNLIRISNNRTYSWFQNYSKDKKNSINGRTKVYAGEDALEELDIDFSKVKNLLNMQDIETSDIYYLKLFTNNKDIKYSYYKMLCGIRDEELVMYNYNDKVIYFFNRSK